MQKEQAQWLTLVKLEFCEEWQEKKKFTLLLKYVL